MMFAGVNYLAILIAGVAGWLVGAVWYGVLGKRWAAANCMDGDAMKKAGMPIVPLVIAFAGNLVMAWVLAGLLGHLGQFTIKDGIISGAFCWLGFTATALSVNYAFAKRKPALLWIDGGHWLAVLIVQGAILGAMGV